ncbi:flippase [Methanobacterium paludis]|uniref:Polysaccharide biosynthesis protein n=1 Tax=Methanobacterium paludis (strain DSM 25820 / JCM 18151 / SWAN1) TaxID=868131 RepID=F6D677_METPW|nr:flippase [Methanobacterium paludis]AEG18290.1 polysaccharide biosynthesis protein [Methanobacterium paludis]
MSRIRTLAKNTTMLFVANVISYLLGFFTTLYTARYLGVEGFGVLSLALSLTGIFGVFTDLGLGTLTTREVSRDKSQANRYIGNTAVMKVFLAFLTFGLIALAVYILNYPQTVKNVVYLITLSVIFGAFTGIFNSIFQAFEKMEYMSLNIILNAVLMLAGVLTVIYYGFDIIALASVYFISSGIILILTFFIYSWKFFLPKIHLDLNFWKPTLNEASFFGLSSILVVIYFYIDSVMLSIMVGNSAVGIYNAAYKLIFVLLFIPSVFVTSIFPLMSQHFESAKNLLKLEYEKSVKYLFAIAMFIFVYGFVFADKIILIIYGGNYTASIAALQALIFVVPIIFITNLFGNILGAINRQKAITIVTGANALINITLNLILIPKFSYIGASAATVATEGLGFILMFTYLSKYFFKISLTQNILKTIFSSILVLISVYYLKINVNWITSAVFGLFAYVLLLYAMKIVTKDDIKIFKGIL